MVIMSLRTSSGDTVAKVEIPDHAMKFGWPEIIQRDGLYYTRQTHNVYHQADCFVLPPSAVG